LPVTLEGAIPFPGRSLIIFLTFAVILSTLVFQGLTFPALVRRLGVRETDDAGKLERDLRTQLLAAAQAALAQVSVDSRNPAVHERALAAVRQRYHEREAHLQDALAQVLGWSDRQHLAVAERQLRDVALNAERAELERLRHQGKVPDELQHALEHELDVEEARLRRSRA
jgi:CPA1 family monovalent cation:H+ antiporter